MTSPRSFERAANWEDLITYYGSDISVHKASLNKAHQATYAMLACKWSASDPARFANCSGEHAEERLLESTVWVNDIPNALASRSDLNTQPMNVTLALNRSPCGHCSLILAQALDKLQFNYARRFENTIFLLASLGYYQSSKFMSSEHDQRHPTSNQPKWVTTQNGLDRLTSSGRRLTTLSFDGKITARGQELSDFLTR